MDGEEREVYNWCNVTTRTQIRGTGMRERWVLSVGAGDSSVRPDYVTEWLAIELQSQLSLYVEDYDIEEIDIESDEVTVL